MRVNEQLIVGAGEGDSTPANAAERDSEMQGAAAGARGYNDEALNNSDDR